MDWETYRLETPCAASARAAHIRLGGMMWLVLHAPVGR